MSAAPDFKPKPITAPAAADELPPNAVECEEILLGGLFMGGKMDSALAEQLNADDFYLTQHGWIFQAMLDLYNDGADEFDPASVAAKLTERGQLAQLDKLGRSGFLALQWFILPERTPLYPAIRANAKIIRNMAVRRRALVQASAFAVALYHDATDPAILIERHTRAVEQIKPFDANKEFVRGSDSAELHEEMLKDQAAHHVWHAVPWAGLADRAPVTMDGDLVVVAGPEGSGKSALLMNWAEYEAQQACPTVYIHTEMNRKHVLDRRLVANRRTIPFAALQKPEGLSEQQWATVSTAGVEMESWLKHLNYWHAGLVDEGKLFAVMQRLADEFGTRCFVLDYLNDVIPEKDRYENGAVAWRNLLAKLEAFNNRNGTRVITAVQLNKGGDSYMVGRALRQKAALFLKIKPKVLEHVFTFEYDGIAYQYVPGDFEPVVTVAVEKYRAGGRGVAKLLFVGPRYLWVDVPIDFDDGHEDPGAYDDHTESKTAKND